MDLKGENFLKGLLLDNNIFSPFVTSLIGLVPNCAASVVITELYLKGAIMFGSLIGGLLTGAGIALLVLFKEENKKEFIKIVVLLYLIGSITGIIINILELI